MKNGWNRLWVLIAFIYLLPVVFFTWLIFPTQNNLYKDWAYNVSIITGEDLNADNDESNYYKDYIERMEKKGSIKKPIYHTYSSPLDDTIKLLEQSEAMKLQRMKYENKLSYLSETQSKILVWAVICWIEPLIIMYIFGFLVRWVYRGFKKQVS